MIVYFIIALFLGVALDLILMRSIGEKRYPFTVVLSVFSMFLLYKTFDENVMIIKGFLFSQVLIFTSFHDVKTKKIPDIVHILIVLIAFIEIKPLFSILGLIIVPLPFLITAVVKNGIGGGDIKLMAACGFMLGIYGGFLAGFSGLLIAVIINFIKGNNKNISFALAPYLGFGAFISYLIS